MLAVWIPPLFALLGLCSALTDSEGRTPSWLMRARESVFRTMWTGYDRVWRVRFGDGEHDEFAGASVDGGKEQGREMGEKASLGI